MEELDKIEQLKELVLDGKELVFKNFVKYIQVLLGERREDRKVTRDLEADREYKLRKLHNLYIRIFKKKSISELDFECVRKIIAHQQFLYDNASEIINIRGEKRVKKCKKACKIVFLYFFISDQPVYVD